MTDLAIQEIARAMFDAVKPNRDFGFDDIEPIKQAYMTGAKAAYAVALKHIEAEVVAWLRGNGSAQERVAEANAKNGNYAIAGAAQTAAFRDSKTADAIERGDYRQEEQS